tara:strand:- start:32 stop:412 length:381 start_codon:yes stop_codon:yes gene_type:complete
MIIIKILLIILLLDFIWLFNLQKNNWKNQIILIQKENANFKINSIILTYILMSVCIYELAIKNVDKKNILKDSIKYGSILGLAMYGVFNLTNYSIFNDYKFETAISDTLWGIFLTITTTYIISNNT